MVVSHSGRTALGFLSLRLVLGMYEVVKSGAVEPPHRTKTRFTFHAPRFGHVDSQEGVDGHVTRPLLEDHHMEARVPPSGLSLSQMDAVGRFKKILPPTCSTLLLRFWTSIAKTQPK